MHLIFLPLLADRDAVPKRDSGDDRATSPFSPAERRAIPLGLVRSAPASEHHRAPTQASHTVSGAPLSHFFQIIIPHSAAGADRRADIPRKPLIRKVPCGRRQRGEFWPRSCKKVSIPLSREGGGRQSAIGRFSAARSAGAKIGRKHKRNGRCREEFAWNAHISPARPGRRDDAVPSRRRNGPGGTARARGRRAEQHSPGLRADRRPAAPVVPLERARPSRIRWPSGTTIPNTNCISSSGPRARCSSATTSATSSRARSCSTGPNLPHNWVSDIAPGEEVHDRDMLIQFSDDVVRDLMRVCPELEEIEPLLDDARYGIEFHGEAAEARRAVPAPDRSGDPDPADDPLPRAARRTQSLVGTEASCRACDYAPDARPRAYRTRSTRRSIS